jgi:hypothetical protein
VIKMSAAARRAHAGSTNTIRRALQAAGIPLVTLAPGSYAVEEEDLERYLRERHAQDSADGGSEPEKPKKSTGAKTKKVDRRR